MSSLKFVNKMNSIWVNAQACKIDHAFPNGVNKGIKFVNTSAGHNKANEEFFIPQHGKKYKIDNCVLETKGDNRLFLNNTKTPYELK